MVGDSPGAVITLKLAAAHPDLIRGILVHEPPMMGLLEDGSPEAAALEGQKNGALAEVGRRIADGDDVGAAQLFVDQVALGPGSWAAMPAAMRDMMTGNAPAYLDELDDPEWKSIDEARLSESHGPVLITAGGLSPPIYEPVERVLTRLLPQARHKTYAGAGHIPHVTHPEEYLAAVVEFIDARQSRQ